jgi:Ca2+-binding EF-hand superfamily protein
MSIKVNASHSADEIKKAFRIFEGNSPPGHVSAEKLVKSLLMYSSESLTKDQAQDLVNQLEIDENGLINYKSFVDMILS